MIISDDFVQILLKSSFKNLSFNWSPSLQKFQKLVTFENLYIFLTEVQSSLMYFTLSNEIFFYLRIGQFILLNQHSKIFIEITSTDLEMFKLS